MFGEDQEKRKKRIADTRAALAATQTLGPNDRRALLALNFQEFPKVITAHRGHRSHAKIESLSVALRHFELAFDSLTALLDEFHAVSDDAAFSDPGGHEGRELRARPARAGSR